MTASVARTELITQDVLRYVWEGVPMGAAMQRVAADHGISLDTVKAYRALAKRKFATDAPVELKINYSQLPRKRFAGRGRTHVTVIGDLHVHPEIPNERCRWLSRHIEQQRPDSVIQIGDLCTFDSLCRYIDNATFEAWREKPTFKEDIAAVDDALDKLALDGIPHHVTLGNHDDRMLSYMNRHPEVYGILTDMYFRTLEKHGWTYSEYGEIVFINGVGFTHVPFNEVGKPYMGKTAEMRIANDAKHDIVMGHTHKYKIVTSPKIGENESVTIINAGCALPSGHVERYAKHTVSGWSYGVLDVWLERGRVSDHSFTTMATLKRRYGK